MRLWVAALWLRFLFFIAAVFLFAGQSAFALATAHVAHGFIEGLSRPKFLTPANLGILVGEAITVFFRSALALMHAPLFSKKLPSRKSHNVSCSEALLLEEVAGEGIEPPIPFRLWNRTILTW